jgi:hypothetical protein
VSILYNFFFVINEVTKRGGVLVPVNLFQPSLTFASKVSLPKRLRPYLQILDEAERVARDKCLFLFGLSVGDEEKMSFITLTKGNFSKFCSRSFDANRFTKRNRNR